jgi:hypothetical protein
MGVVFSSTVLLLSAAVVVVLNFVLRKLLKLFLMASLLVDDARRVRGELGDIV